MDHSPPRSTLISVAGIVWGLGAMLTWGIADYLARVNAERIGSRSTSLLVQTVGLILPVIHSLIPNQSDNPVQSVIQVQSCLRLSEIEKYCRVNARMDPRDLSPRADKKCLIANGISPKKKR